MEDIYYIDILVKYKVIHNDIIRMCGYECYMHFKYKLCIWYFVFFYSAVTNKIKNESRLHIPRYWSASFCSGLWDLRWFIMIVVKICNKSVKYIQNTSALIFAFLLGKGAGWTTIIFIILVMCSSIDISYCACLQRDASLCTFLKDVPFWIGKIYFKSVFYPVRHQVVCFSIYKLVKEIFMNIITLPSLVLLMCK